jgi:hypothetical protein
VLILGATRSGVLGEKVLWPTEEGPEREVALAGGRRQLGRMVPTAGPHCRRTMAFVSMYVQILSSALDDWVGQLTSSALIEYALVCRAAITHPSPYGGTRSADVLAAQVAYDQALIRLCELHGIEVDTAFFMHPKARPCLEAKLSTVGVNLVKPPGCDPDRSEKLDGGAGSLGA